MTKTEAIKWLSNLKVDIGKTQHQELWHYEQALDEIIQALGMTIEALEQEPKWIPVTKALPTKGVKVLVQTSYPNLTYVAEIGSFLSRPEGWRTADGYEKIEQTVAWMPLPEPYVEGAEQ